MYIALMAAIHEVCCIQPAYSFTGKKCMQADYLIQPGKDGYPG
ncbi:hypothetical protein [Chitinophaga solisilvae]|nr:hypothetical protein [Chitinophaga solisilvae]